MPIRINKTNKKVNEALLKLGSFEKKYKTNRKRNRNDKIIDK